MGVNPLGKLLPDLDILRGPRTPFRSTCRATPPLKGPTPMGLPQKSGTGRRRGQGQTLEATKQDDPLEHNPVPRQPLVGIFEDQSPRRHVFQMLSEMGYFRP